MIQIVDLLEEGRHVEAQSLYDHAKKTKRQGGLGLNLSIPLATLGERFMVDRLDGCEYLFYNSTDKVVLVITYQEYTAYALFMLFRSGGKLAFKKLEKEMNHSFYFDVDMLLALIHPLFPEQHQEETTTLATLPVPQQATT
jgi:hypothetical protein